ncbi:MAG: hypothetical protein VX751_04010, partial [Pseudomonadota bacterium]|nr:hypothetical protein [Pseudomonadota bacterium]
KAIKRRGLARMGRPEVALLCWPASAGTISYSVLKTRSILFAADNIRGGLMISPKIIAYFELR